MTVAVPRVKHDAFPFASDDELVRGLLPWIEDGVDAGEAVSIAMTGDHVRSVRDALGNSADLVRFHDSTEWYRKPARTILGWHQEIRAALDAGATSVRAAGEVRFGDPAEEDAEWIRYESIVNAVFEGSPAWLVCPYDQTRVSAEVLGSVSRTHPAVWNGIRRRSEEYLPPTELLAMVSGPHRGLPDGARSIPVAELREMRSSLWRAFDAAGWDGSSVDDFITAFSEIATNAIRHGGGISGASIAIRDLDATGEVRDRAGRLDDPLAGFRPPADAQEGGAGLWLARQLTSWLVIEPEPDSGTSVRFAVERRD